MKVGEKVRRLLESWMPLRVVSQSSQREKNMRRGHISTLHQWWSRKPLVASRAAVFASLMPEHTGRDALLPLCECAPTQEAIDEASALLQKEYGRPPRLLDPFSGGGSIPLEALRLGCEVFANDLNPVAHLLLHCTLHYPQRWQQQLPDDVFHWGEWVLSKVTQELADLYVVPPHTPSLAPSRRTQLKLTSSAYLWTRDVKCHNPTCLARVPMLRKSWLCRRPGRFIALQVSPNLLTRRVAFTLLSSTARKEKDAINAFGFDPAAFSKGGHANCMFCGVTIPASHVRAEGKAGRLGLQLMAVACTENGKRGKHYIDAEEAIAWQPSEEVLQERLHALLQETGMTCPDDPLPPPGSLGVSIQNYGMTRWSDLYTSRQMLTMLTFCKWVKAATQEITAARRQSHPTETSEDSDAYAKAVTTYLAFGVTKIANRGSTLVIYNPRGEKLESPISNGRMSFNWDIAETNPLGDASGNYRENLKYTVEALRSLCFATKGKSHISRGPAQWLDLPDRSIDVVVTDPPYYDNVPYASLADYFYIWLKRMLDQLYIDALALPLTPKKRELVVDPNKHKGSRQEAHAVFEAGMGEALQEMHRVLCDDGVLVLIYAHKTTLGWSSLIDALRQSQFEVTEAWPLATERASRLRAQRSAALASSIFLSARKRSRHQPGHLTRDVLPDLQQIVEERVNSLFAQGIQGTDLVIACVGAGLRAFTRYPSVELPGGEMMTTIQFLQEVQREVIAQILSQVMGLEGEAIAHIDRKSQLYTIARFQYGEAAIPYDEANTLAKGLGLELQGADSLLSGRRALATKRGGQICLKTFQERGPACEVPAPDQLLHTPTIDLLHRLLWMLDEQPNAVLSTIEAWQSILPHLRLLAQALSGRTFDANNPNNRPQRSTEEQQIDLLLATPHFVQA